jgi:hypothetical protein
MKRRLIITISLFVVVLAVSRFTRQERLVQALDARYKQVQHGMDMGVVGLTMNRNTFIVTIRESGTDSEDLSGWWDNTPLDPHEADRIQSAMCCTAPRFFGTVRYVFTFDKNDKLVGKHRFY